MRLHRRHCCAAARVHVRLRLFGKLLHVWCLRALRVGVLALNSAAAAALACRAAALRAAEIEADILMKATMVDGVYNKDPNKYDDAVKYDELTYTQMLADNLAVMDGTAATMCRDNKIPILVFDLNRPDNIYDAAMGMTIGTTVKED